jgi:2'-5' RNA ligase
MRVVQSYTQPSCRHHEHEHRLDEDEIKPRHWFARAGLTNGRRAKLHTTLPPSGSVPAETASRILTHAAAVATAAEPVSLAGLP